MPPHPPGFSDQQVATYWIVLDSNGHHLKALPHRLPYADLVVTVIITADEKFTLAEETVTWKQRPKPSSDLAPVLPAEEGWSIIEDRGASVVWRRPNTIAFSRRDIVEMMRTRKGLRARNREAS